MFSIGQRIVCIWGPEEWANRTDEAIPVEKDIYRVRSMFRTKSGKLGVRLHEIVNSPKLYNGVFSECGYDSDGFRPIDHTFGEWVQCTLMADAILELHNQTQKK